MKAALVKQYGDSTAIKIEEVAVPTIKPNQVLVKVGGSSINPFDVMVRTGALQKMIPLTLPYTIGGDFAGTIVELGSQVTGLTIGDKVYGQAVVVNGGSGATAEYVASNVNNMAIAPNCEQNDVASLPLAGASAIQAIEDHLNVQSGEKILIHGGAGGIGSLAIQIAKARGAYVATTVSKDDSSFVTQLGADLVIDYKNQKFEEIVHDYEAVFDTVGGKVTDRSLNVIKKGGKLATMIGEIDERKAQSMGITAIRQQTMTTTAILERLATMVDSGKVVPRVDRVFPLAETVEAYRYFESGHPKGKVVIEINS